MPRLWALGLEPILKSVAYEIEPKDRHDLGQCDLHCRLTHAHQKAAYHNSDGNPPAMGRSGWIEKPSQA